MTENENKSTPLEAPLPGKTPRWMKVTLVISLAANLLIIGAVAGAVVSKGGKPHMRDSAPRGAIANVITEALPKDDRRALGREVRRAMRSETDNRQKLRTEIASLAEMMRAPETDVEMLNAQLGQIQSRMMRQLSVARGVLSERLAGFDASERAAYADRLEMMIDKAGR